MGFTVFARSCPRRLPPGVVSISKGGRMLFALDDLQSAKIKDRATLLIDDQLCRLAIRGPRGNEDSVALGKSGPKAKARRVVQAAGALTAIGLSPDDFAGRHTVTMKDGLLIVAFER